MTVRPSTRRQAIAGALAVAALPGAALAAGHGAAEPKKKGGGASYIQFPTLTATIVRTNGRRGVLTVESGLDVPDSKLRDVAVASQPRLRDAYVRFLQTFASGLGAGALPNIELLAAAMQRSTDQVLGKPGAKVLLGTVIAS